MPKAKKRRAATERGAKNAFFPEKSQQAVNASESAVGPDYEKISLTAQLICEILSRFGHRDRGQKFHLSTRLQTGFRVGLGNLAAVVNEIAGPILPNQKRTLGMALIVIKSLLRNSSDLPAIEFLCGICFAGGNE